MGAFLSYSMVSGLLLLAMYLIFRLTLAGQKQHGYNRAVVLAMYAVAFLAQPVARALKGSAAPQSTGAMIPLPPLGTAAYKPIWGSILILIYIAGMVAVAAGTLVTWLRIIRIIARGEKIRRDEYTLVLTDDEGTAPFSWMRCMVMSRTDHEASGDVIAAHELRHIQARHWIDLLVAQAVAIVNWFNPAAWLTREELILIHEYQADMAVIDGGHNPQEYQMLLIRKAVGARFPSLANSLNHSKLKKRITMMYQENSSKRQRLNALALLPAAALALALTATPQVSAAISKIENSGLEMIARPDTVTAYGTFEADTVRVVGYGVFKKSDNAIDSTGLTLKVKDAAPVVIVDGKEVPYEQLSKISPNTIKAIEVSKDGKKIIITTKD